jgi:hypothetical protein
MLKQTLAVVTAAAITLSTANTHAGIFDYLGGSDCDAPSCDSLCGDSLSSDSLCCDSLCDGGCDSVCAAGGFLSELSLRKSDHCFDDFISPMSNFVFFEDPRTLTELRPIFVHHNLPSRLGTLGINGGETQLLAAQFRIALTERLSLIAVKDGYIWAQNEAPLDGLFNDGWADVTAGLKYNLVRDVETGTLMSIGGTYEIPLGDNRAFQSVGDGEFHLFTSYAKRLMSGDAHYMTTFGWRLPTDGDVQTESLHWSNHLDLRLTKSVYAVAETVWWHWVGEASVPGSLPLGVGGQDLFNFPVNNVEGNNLVTQAVGMKYKPSGDSVQRCSFRSNPSGYDIPVLNADLASFCLTACPSGREFGTRTARGDARAV